MCEKPSYNEATTQTASVSINRTIRVCRYRHPRALLEDKTGHEFIGVVTYRFSKLMKANQTTEITATIVATVFINDWMANFRIPSKVSTDNRPQLTSKFFQDIFAELGVKPLRPKDHPQINGRVKRSNATTVSGLRPYVA